VPTEVTAAAPLRDLLVAAAAAPAEASVRPASATIPEAKKPAGRPLVGCSGAAATGGKNSKGALNSRQPTLLLLALLLGLAIGARVYVKSHPAVPGGLGARVTRAWHAAAGAVQAAGAHTATLADAAAAGAVAAARTSGAGAAAAARAAGGQAVGAARAVGAVGLQALSDLREFYHELFQAGHRTQQATSGSAVGGVAAHGGGVAAQQAARPASTASWEDAGAWDTEDLAALLPPGSAWKRVAEDISKRLRRSSGANGAREHAAVLLLGCGTAGDCAAAAAALGALRGVSRGCALQLEGVELAATATAPGGGGGEAAGAAMHAAISPVVGRCPSALVVLRDAQLLPIDALPALHAALADGGNAALRGAFVLLLQLGSAADARAAALGDPAEVSAWLQGLLFEDTLAPELASIADQQRATQVLEPMLHALRQRVDLAALLRLSAAGEEEASADAEAEAVAAAA
jgi:hypothetical protein